MNYCKFASFNVGVETKTKIIQMEPKFIKSWLENESKTKLIV